MLPSPQVLKSLGERFGVPVIRERIFGQDYAKTLATWRNNFRAAWPNLRPLGFDDRFRRLWKYYLAYCEAGFLSGKYRRAAGSFREVQLSFAALQKPFPFGAWALGSRQIDNRLAKIPRP
jgi:cyclopropane-fatty-acyl-phospholipid synthase